MYLLNGTLDLTDNIDLHVCIIVRADFVRLTEFIK